ncbi:MAG: membrane dipeptidase [Alphaproteobacteria bacterium]|nr:membrane dipeptidase [Alphaproteobacteria bacterium]MCB9796112.1 membrane dipeptidase [Alphaproteobacteria bacterium]
MLLLTLLACDPQVELDPEGQALTCVSLSDGRRWMAAEADAYGFSAKEPEAAARFFLQPADLGVYLLYDEGGGYLVAEEGPLLRQTTLESDYTRLEDGYVSGAEWGLEPSERDAGAYQLRHQRSGLLLSDEGLTDKARRAARLTLTPAEGCLAHPELSLDATGEVQRTHFEDGDLYGVVDTHSHILSNFGFGGWLYHGAPFHRLGVEHALPDCERVHGVAGRQDFFGYAFDSVGNDSDAFTRFIPDLAAGELSEDNHATDGYPTFSAWPDARDRATHQTQYYRWLERAWMAGLRLVVQHATTNSVICNLTVGEGYQPARYDCEDMTAVDRILDEVYNMERYIDARSGGAGQGWFRIVTSPAEAREVIAEGKLAVVLGIETSDLFRCHLTRRPDGPVCDEAYLREQLDAYHARGVRALFPVHKYDNAFSPGDGSGDFIEVGNFLNSGHWTNMTEDCPGGDMPAGFDHGAVTFGGLLEPREDYLSEAPNDFSDFPEEPLLTIAPFLPELISGSAEGEWCQNAGLTDLGETLMLEMMKRGMIIEVDHLPQWSYQRAFELLELHDYPAAGTHGRNWGGRIYALGGISKSGLGRCHDPEVPGSSLRGYLDTIALIEANGGYPAEGVGFDFNGFASARGPRFGEEGCGEDQADPITYPFTSYAGDVEFTQPYVGERMLDFNTEGFVHVGLMPELIQDARADALSDEDLEPLFRSAEGYIRMWEKAEARAAAGAGR